MRNAAAITIAAALVLAGCAILDPPDPVSGVMGRVVDVVGRPIPGVEVTIPGQPAVTTDATGVFHVPGATTPYDVTLIHGSGPEATLFLGLERSNPVLVVMGLDLSGDTHSASISGTLRDASNDPLDLDEGEWASVAIESPHINIGGVTESGEEMTDGAYSFNAFWLTPSETTGRVHGLYWEGAGSATHWIASTYLGYGAGAELTITPDANLTDVDVTLNPVSTATLSGDIGLPTDFAILDNQLKVFPSGNASFWPVWDNQSPASSFSYAIPLISGGEYALSVFARHSDGDAESIVVRRGDLAAASGLEITVPEPHALLSPADFDSAEYGDTFSWTGFPDGVYVVTIRESPVVPVGEMQPLAQVIGAPIITVYTSATSMILPDLSDLGVELDMGEYYEWRVFAMAPFDSLDDLAVGPILTLMTLARVHEGDYATPAERTFQFGGMF